MSISHELMWKYYTLCTDLASAEIAKLRAENRPMDAKRQLAKLIITDFHDAAAAEKADEEFRRIFSERQAPTDMEEKTLPAASEPQFLTKVIPILANLATSITWPSPASP